LETISMGLILVSFVISCLLLSGAWLLLATVDYGVRWLASQELCNRSLFRWMRKHPALPILSVAIGSLALLLWILPRLDESMKWEGTHVTYDQAESFPCLSDLPRDASDINYYFAYLGVNADFLVSEKEFIDWCAARGWTPIEIQHAYPGFTYKIYRGRLSDGDSVDLRNGLVCNGMSHRGGIAVAWDRDSGRAYFNMAHH